MLGSLLTQQLFASANSIAAIPQINAEWNYNSFLQPSVITSASTEKITSTNLNASLSWSNDTVGGVINSSISQSQSNVGQVTIDNPSGSALIFTTLKRLDETGFEGSGNITSRVKSNTISLGTEGKGLFYKLVFYVKVGGVNYTDGYPSIITGSVTSISNPSTTASTYYRVVGIGSSGQTLGLDLVNNSDIITASVSSSSVSSSSVTLKWASDPNATAYRIYRSADKVSTTYITTTWGTTYTDYISSNIGAIPEPSAPAAFSSHIQVSPQIVANNSSDSGVQVVSFIKSTNVSTGQMEKTQASIEAVVDIWKKVEVWFGSPGTKDDTDSPNISNIVLSLSMLADYENAQLLASNFSLYQITEHDFFLNEYFPADSAFLPFRPGEALLNTLTPTTDKRVQNFTPTPIVKPITFAVKNPQFYLAKEVLSPTIQLLPSPYDKFKYYISDKSHKSIQANYDSYLSINKIVLKYATSFNTIASGSITIYTGSTNTASVVPLTSSDFTASGLTVLYYNGTGWSTSSWSSPPTLNTDGSLKNVVTQVRGIKFTAGTVTPKDFSSYGSNGNLYTGDDLKKVHIVEFSPRLEVDLSDILQEYSIKKDLTSPNSNGFPLSYINSNSGTLSFSNIPIYQSSGSAFTIFENQSKNATFYNLMRQGVKFTAFLKSPTFQTDLLENVPQFVMYSNSWEINDIGDVSVDLFDITKVFSQGAEAPQFSTERSDLFSIITTILNISGFSDYDYDGLKNVCMSTTKSTNFWFDETKTVFENLQDIFITHQIGAYIDEYGIMRFKSLSQIFNQFNESNFSANFAVTDTASVVAGSNYIANIIPDSYSESISEKIGKIVARYRIAQGNDSADVNTKNKGAAQIVSTNTETSAQVWQEDNNTGLPSFELNHSLRVNDSYLSFDPQKQFGGNPRLALSNYEGDLMIGNEIVGYSGIEYRFYPKGSNDKYVTKVVRGSADIVEGISYLRSIYPVITSVEYQPTGKIVGLQRGKYGTPISSHPISNATEIASSFSFYKYSQHNSAATTTSQSSVSAPKSSGLSLSTYKANEYVMLKANTKTSNMNLFAVDFRVPTTSVSKKSKYGRRVNVKKNGKLVKDANGKVKTKLVYNTAYTDFHNLAFGIFFNMNSSAVASTIENSTHFIEIASKQASSGTKRVEYTISLYRIDKVGSNQVEKQLVGKTSVHSVFDGESHRLAAYINNDSIVVALDNSIVIQKYVTLTNKPTRSFGVYAKCLEKDQRVEVLIDEVYADSVQPINRKQPSIYNYDISSRYYFTTKDYLDNLLKSVPNYSSPFLFQTKPQARGIKIYDIKFGLSPIYQETARIIPIQYGSRTTTEQTNAQAKVLGPVVQNDLKYSGLHATPFRAKFAVVNNCEEIVYLNSAADSGITPFHINAKFQKLLEEQTIERVLDPNYINNSIELRTEWLPSASEVEKLIATLSKALNGFYTDINISVFGNPLVQVGDFAQITYSLKRVGYDPTPGSTVKPLICLVTSVGQGFSGGVSDTRLTLKPIITP